MRYQSLHLKLLRRHACWPAVGVSDLPRATMCFHRRLSPSVEEHGKRRCRQGRCRLSCFLVSNVLCFFHVILAQYHITKTGIIVMTYDDCTNCCVSLLLAIIGVFTVSLSYHMIIISTVVIRLVVSYRMFVRSCTPRQQQGLSFPCGC